MLPDIRGNNIDFGNTFLVRVIYMCVCVRISLNSTLLYFVICERIFVCVCVFVSVCACVCLPLCRLSMFPLSVCLWLYACMYKYAYEYTEYKSDLRKSEMMARGQHTQGCGTIFLLLLSHCWRLWFAGLMVSLWC